MPDSLPNIFRIPAHCRSGKVLQPCYSAALISIFLHQRNDSIRGLPHSWNWLRRNPTNQWWILEGLFFILVLAGAWAKSCQTKTAWFIYCIGTHRGNRQSCLGRLCRLLSTFSFQRATLSWLSQAGKYRFWNWWLEGVSWLIGMILSFTSPFHRCCRRDCPVLWTSIPESSLQRHFLSFCRQWDYDYRGFPPSKPSNFR